MDYIIEVYGELNYITRAFQMVAHLFSKNSDYLGLLVILSTTAIFFTAIFATIKSGLGKADIKSWIMYVSGTFAIMLVITGPKVNVTIHDLTINEIKVVGGVPEVMALIGTLENNIERTIIDMITFVMNPLIDYEDIGKGKGFQLLAESGEMAEDFLKVNPHTRSSVDNYFKECVVSDIKLGFEPSDIIHNSEDIWVSMQSETRSRYSVVYTRTDAQGSLYTCADAWVEIDKQLKDPSIELLVKQKCEETYGIGIEKCSSNLNEIVVKGVGAKSLNKYLRSYIVAEIMMGSTGMVESAKADINKKNMSSAIMAESQLPRLKGVMFGLMIGIFPLLVLFLFFNPVKAISFYLGMFIMMVLWGSLDAFMDMQYQNEVMNMYSTMRKPGNELGVHQMFDISNTAADAVSLYGSSRWLMLGLATAISSAITGINSYAMSQFGSQLGATAQQAAGSRADSLGTAGDMRLKQQAAEDLGLRMAANDFTVANQGMDMASSQYQDMMNRAGTAGNNRDYWGSDQAAVQANISAGIMTSASSIGAAGAASSQANSLGLSADQFGAFNANKGVLTEGMASSLNAKFGVDSFNADQTLTYGYAGGELKNMQLSSNDGIGITQALDNQGNIMSTTMNGLEGGTTYTGYTVYEDGTKFGSKTFDEGGVKISDTFNGSRKTRSYSENGQQITEGYVMASGQEILTSTQKGNEYALSGQGVQNILQGDASLVQGDWYTNDELNSRGRVALSQVASELNSFMSESISEGSGNGNSSRVSVSVGTSLFNFLSVSGETDMSTFNNLSTEQRVDAIKSGLINYAENHNTGETVGMISGIYNDALGKGPNQPIDTTYIDQYNQTVEDVKKKHN